MKSQRMMKLLAAMALTLALLGATGCIRSRVLITSEPSGAEVLWRGKPYGATPVTIPFIWYWYYDYEVTKPGYQKVEVLERLRTPPWFLLPTDLLMEMIPVPIPDQRERHFVLEPLPPTQGVELPEQGVRTLTVP